VRKRWKRWNHHDYAIYAGACFCDERSPPFQVSKVPETVRVALLTLFIIAGKWGRPINLPHLVIEIRHFRSPRRGLGAESSLVTVTQVLDVMLCETYACARWGSLDLSARTSQADQLPQPMPLPLPLMHIVAGSGIIWRYGRRGPGDLIHRTEVMSELLLNMSIEIYTTGIPVFRSLLSRKFSSFLYSFYLEQV
jgi:hypothetical protein